MAYSNKGNSRDNNFRTGKRSNSDSESRKPRSKDSQFSSDRPRNTTGFKGKSSYSQDKSEGFKPRGKDSQFSSDRPRNTTGFKGKSSYSQDKSEGFKPRGKDSQFSSDRPRNTTGFKGKSSYSQDKSEGFKPRSKDSQFSSDRPRNTTSFKGKSNYSQDKSDDFKYKSKDFGAKSQNYREKADGFSSKFNEQRDQSNNFRGNSKFSKDRSEDFKSNAKDFGNRSRSFKESSGRFDSNSDERKERSANSYSKTSSYKGRNDNFKPKFDSRNTEGKRSNYSRDKNDFESKGERIAPSTRGRRQQESNDDLIRLNRYISNAGICSRRKADELIGAGVISVNGEVISELGHKVDPYKDEIRFNGELLKRERKVYVLLNKPKDYITTTDDPQERKTVMHLVEKASKERIYPVGRLDRNTTGLLLMTNDGELAEKLSHPRNGITKMYHVELSRNLTQGDFNKIQFGIELEDGLIKPDNISYVTGATKKELGIQIHSGKNRIVRRIFEHLGYEVVKLDRVVYGNLTKKDLPRGRWRFLEDHELIQLKHLI